MKHSRNSHWLGAAIAGLVIGLGFGGYSYPVTSHIIGNGKSLDVVDITMYINLHGVTVTKSHVMLAKITCIDVVIDPATILQSCYND